MQCEKEHRHHDEHHHRPHSREECLAQFDDVTFNSPALCPPDWDPASEICWPPTAAGSTASTPCPDKPDLNVLHNACRQCLFNGTWFVDHDQDGREPFTDYNDCFIFEEEEYRLRIEALIGKDTLLIYETINEPEPLQFWLHGASLALLGTGLVIWFYIWLWKRQTTKSNTGKHKYMVSSYAVLTLLQSLYVSYSCMNYHTLFTCYVFRMTNTFLESLIYASVLFYTLNTALYVSGVTYSNLIRRFVNVTCVLAIVVITCVEGYIEIDLHPHDFCAFGIYLNPLHWTILWVKLSLNGTSFTLVCVSLFGLLYLHIPPAATSRTARTVKQNMVMLLFWIVFCYILQFAPIFVYHMQKLKYSYDDVIRGSRVYANLMASSGLVFAFTTWVLDLEVLALVFPFVKKYLDDGGDDVPALRVKVIKAERQV